MSGYIDHFEPNCRHGQSDGCNRIRSPDHTTNDMAGPDEDSWVSILKAEGYEVTPILKVLGSNDEFVDILVDHIKDAAKSRGITLH